MLEQAGLRLYPWKVADNDIPPGGTMSPEPNVLGDGIRRIATLRDNQLVGFARWHRARWPWWLAWLAGQEVQIFETEDASLVQTLHRPWGLWRGWEVLDAEDRTVGFLYRGFLVDAYGQRLGRMVAPGPATPGQIVGQQQDQLASWLAQADGSLELTFGHETNPFLRMIVLGAVLLFC